MDDLFAELRPIDKELMRLKKIKYENGDPYGTLENTLEDKIQSRCWRPKWAAYLTEFHCAVVATLIYIIHDVCENVLCYVAHIL